MSQWDQFRAAENEPGKGEGSLAGWIFIIIFMTCLVALMFYLRTTNHTLHDLSLSGRSWAIRNPWHPPTSKEVLLNTVLGAIVGLVVSVGAWIKSRRKKRGSGE